MITGGVDEIIYWVRATLKLFKGAEPISGKVTYRKSICNKLG